LLEHPELHDEGQADMPEVREVDLHVKWHGKRLRGVTRWEVRHSEGADHGLRPQRFGSRREAVLRAREWNKDFPGHVVCPVLPHAQPRPVRHIK
jgi:hypothetical protein